MSEHIDEGEETYLWTGQGPASADVAELERELRGLRWRPRELALDVADVAEVAPERLAKIEVAPERPRREIVDRRWLPALAGALLAASAVLVWRLALRAPAPEAPPAFVEPGASPDLKDPFGPRRERGFTAPVVEQRERDPQRVSPDLKDPFEAPEPRGRRRVSPDLKDPFADSADSPPSASAPSKVSPDLVDPFGGGGAEPAPAPAPGLTDPFTGEPRKTKRLSPDLKDPFARDEEPGEG